MDGSKFVELMENCGVKPKDLGIDPTYKLKLKKGERRPSKELVEKLLELCKEMRRPGFEPGIAGSGGRRPRPG
ncbi:hypothetical protein ATG_17590 [Desulfurococcaceae archaeon AG1]|nr:hypothetical protein ATG_17590 [Desulfurococcaceae archaeon AG1]